MEFIKEILHTFLVFNQNAFYYILYFLKHNYMMIFVLCAVAYMFYEEMHVKNEAFVDDRRRII